MAHKASFSRLLEILTILEDLTSTGSLQLLALNFSVFFAHWTPTRSALAGPKRNRSPQR
ncbi:MULTISPECIES: hypothetical protein [unclassified Paraburkholderia]|uniref:hypothetical protein n=1 Tax=unclassified Paraburkholderia TaxID=2615204 RepID=UPI001607E178|nr:MULTISPECIES: hypothetical protein [unclassified Paraburkholderia]MBB5443046.1 hypothetical protein [Paraburkholderia sp. WSM4177]MBB5483349.1 hypothetical protein [Paraburkholderia sp. WSM4180]